LSSIDSLGDSVARAKAAKVSMIRFTHKIYTEVSTFSPKIAAPIKTIAIATTLTVI
jgi:hypothetical protein